MAKIKVLHHLNEEDRKLLKWDEARHPRGEDGKFGSGGGEGTGYAAQRGYGGHGEAPKAERKERAKADAAEERARANYPVKAGGENKESKKDGDSLVGEIVGYEDGKPVYGGAKLEARVAARQKEWEEAGRPNERAQEEKTKHGKGLSAGGFELDRWHKMGDADSYHYTTLDSYGNEKKAFASKNKKGGYDADTIGSGLIGPKKTSHATLEEARAAGLKRLKDAPDMEPYPEGKAETHEHWVNRVKEAKKIDLPDFMPGYFEGKNEAK